MYSHPFASLENETLQIDYPTGLGPRIIGLYAKGVEGNLFAVTPDQHWPTPHGEYYLHGGHRLWTAPEDPFYTVPKESVLIHRESNKVILRSHVDASELEKEISFELEKDCLALKHKLTWHGSEPIELAPWAITQVRLGGMAILPLSTATNGLLPNRNLVLWPYSRLTDDRLDLHDDLVILHGHAADEAFKIGNYNHSGWIAYAMGEALFIKRFHVDLENRYPDMGCNVEVYVKNSCVELETLGTLKVLEPGASVTYEEIWQVMVGEYPATLETARAISKQLSKL